MADIRINQLPLATGGTAPAPSDVVALDGTTTRKAPLSSLGDVVRPFASQAEAEAGTNNTKTMTPLTTAQAIDAQALKPGEAATPLQGSKADSAMQPSIYDPTNVISDAFDLKNIKSTPADRLSSGVWQKSVMVNVREYGALGNGIANDGPAILAAMSAVSAAGGGFVFIPGGTYMTGVQLGVPSSVQLVGYGMKVTTIKAMSTLTRDQNVITNASNNNTARTNYDSAIRIADLKIEGNDAARSGTRVAGQGSNICLSTVKDCWIERVWSVEGSTHNFDIMASTYISAGGSFVQPLGPSLGVTVVDCVSETPGYDDCYTVHNSGYVKFVRCRAFGPSSYEFSYGFEFDEGSYGCVAEDCYVGGGFIRAFASKGHPVTHGSQYNNFIRCTSDGNSQGFWLFHSPTGGGPNNWGISIRDCVIKDPVDNVIIDDWSNLMEIAHTSHVEVANLTIINPGKGIIKINTGANDVRFDGVHIYGVATLDPAWTDKLGIFTIYGGVVARANITITNVKAFSAQPRPIIFSYDGDGTFEFDKIDADGTDNTLGMIRITGALLSTLVIRSLFGTGWAGQVLDASQSRAYSNNLNIEMGGVRTMSLSTGSPEGSVYAPLGTSIFVRDSTTWWDKTTAGSSNTGWLKRQQLTVLSGAVTYNPPSLADGSGVTTTVTVAGAALGDIVSVGHTQPFLDVTVTGWVSAADTVSVRFQNESGGTVDIVNGTLRAYVFKYPLPN